jgi:hypothetical protein
MTVSRRRGELTKPLGPRSRPFTLPLLAPRGIADPLGYDDERVALALRALLMFGPSAHFALVRRFSQTTRYIGASG